LILIVRDAYHGEMSVSFNFDSGDFLRQIKAEAEKAARQSIIERVRKISPNVKVTFTGSLDRNNMEVILNGPDDQVAAAQADLKT
jgi:hypothetical protein